MNTKEVLLQESAAAGVFHLEMGGPLLVLLPLLNECYMKDIWLYPIRQENGKQINSWWPKGAQRGGRVDLSRHLH